MRYTAGDDGFRADVTYEQLEVTPPAPVQEAQPTPAPAPAPSVARPAQPPVPLVLVRSPDPIFSGLGQTASSNPKRNIIQQQQQQYHQPYYLGQHFQPVDTAHYFVPKLPPPPLLRRNSYSRYQLCSVVLNKWVADYENKSKHNQKSFLN